MDLPTYQRMPATIAVREVEVRIEQPGFRTRSLVVATTLTNAKKYPKDAIADLYHERWLAELDIRAIKVTLGMDVLRCKTPAMIRKEIWTSLLAYNLIRRTILQSAHRSGGSPRQLSFTAALQAVAASWLVIFKVDNATAARLVEAEIASLTTHRVGHRPGRVEPRAVKRRPKPHKLLTRPRAEARAELSVSTST
jgi:hypothetical protein